MDTKIIKNINEAGGGALVVGFFEDEKMCACLNEFDNALNGALQQMLGDKEIRTKLGECVSILSFGALSVKRIVAVGLGKKDKYGRCEARKATANAARMVQNYKDDIITLHLSSLSGVLNVDEAAEALTEGARLGTYVYDKYLTSKKDRLSVVNILTTGEDNAAEAAAGSAEGDIISDGVILARDMVNEAPAAMNPVLFAEIAAKKAKEYGLSYEEINEKTMKEKGLNAILAVSAGSEEPPRLLICCYKGREEDDKTDLAMIGKGITFDSGGLSLKPASAMNDMKSDMAGAASVLGAICAISRMGLAINVAAVMPLAENMPSGRALKIGDVINTYDGKTVEVLNTDAEGRLVLCDALSYAKKNLQPTRMVDIATLTGAAMRALGLNTTAVFTNNQDFLAEVEQAAKYAGENTWQLPLSDEHSEMIKSEVADIKNTGGDYAGASTAAAFLKEFVGETPWVHMDIAGPSFVNTINGHIVKGATGVPVATLVALAAGLSQNSNE